MKTKELKEIARENGYEIISFDIKILLKREGFAFENTIDISKICENRVWIQNNSYCDDADIKMIKAAIAYAKTPLEDRESEKEKRYIIPLPGLMTTDGEQQLLTYKNGHFFASRRNEVLRQTWKEKHLCHVPYQYRGYAVEVEE